MILDILRRTPVWVFVLFAVLIALGLLQTRTRTLAMARIVALPAVFVCLSLYGVVSVFRANPLSLACWLAALAAAVLLVRALGMPGGVEYSPARNAFTVPGSWWPLALMMAIFFIRYAVAVALAMNPSLLQQAPFAAIVSLTYGLPSGVFLGRALNILRSAKQVPAGAVA